MSFIGDTVFWSKKIFSVPIAVEKKIKFLITLRKRICLWGIGSLKHLKVRLE